MKKRKVLTKLDENCPSKFPRSVVIDPKVLGGRGLVGISKRTPNTTNSSIPCNLSARGATTPLLDDPCSNTESKRKINAEFSPQGNCQRKSGNFTAFSTGAGPSRNRDVHGRKNISEKLHDVVMKRTKVKNLGVIGTRKEQWKPTLTTQWKTKPGLSINTENLVHKFEPSIRGERIASRNSRPWNEPLQGYSSSNHKLILPSSETVRGTETKNEPRGYPRDTTDAFRSNYTIGGELLGRSTSLDESETNETTPCKSDDNSARLLTGRNDAKTTTCTSRNDLLEHGEEQNTDLHLHVWSVEEHNSSSPLRFKIDNRMYLHPRLPPGWEMIVSETQKRPFYVHPDFGSTWHCPVILPRKSYNSNCGNIGGEKNNHFPSTCHSATKRKKSCEVNATTNSERLLERSVSSSMSELVTSYVSEKTFQVAFHDPRPITSSSGLPIDQSKDKKDLSSDTENSPLEICRSPHYMPQILMEQDTHFVASDLELSPNNCDRELELDQESHDDIIIGVHVQNQGRELQTTTTSAKKCTERSRAQGSLFHDMRLALSSSSRTQRDNYPCRLSPCLQHTLLDSPELGFGLATKKVAEDMEAKKNYPETAKNFIELKTNASVRDADDKNFCSGPSIVSGRDFPHFCLIRENNPWCTQSSMSCAKKVHVSLLQGSSRSIFRHASALDATNLPKTRTASTESSSMSESASSIQSNQSSDRKIEIVHPGPPSIAFSVVAQTSKSALESSSDTMEFQHSLHRRNLLQGMELDVDKYYSECSLGKAFVTTPGSTSDQTGKEGRKLAGSNEKASKAQSTSTMCNEPASPSSHTLCFDDDLVGSCCGMTEQPTSCHTTPVRIRGEDYCGCAEKSIAADQSGDLVVETTEVICRQDSPSMQSLCDVDFPDSDNTDEGPISASKGSRASKCSVRVGKVVHPSRHATCNKSPSALLVSKVNVVRRGATETSKRRRWEVWNHPLCSLQRLDKLHKYHN